MQPSEQPQSTKPTTAFNNNGSHDGELQSADVAVPVLPDPELARPPANPSAVEAVARDFNSNYDVDCEIGPDDWEELDEVRAEVVRSVMNRDIRDDQAELALDAFTRAKGEIHEQAASQEKLGSREHVEGIRRSGWAPWGSTFKNGSYAIMAGDAVVSFLCASRALARPALVVLVVIALGAALVGKTVGKSVATGRFVDPTNRPSAITFAPSGG